MYALLKTLQKLLENVVWPQCAPQDLPELIEEKIGELEHTNSNIPETVEGHWKVFSAEESVQYLTELLEELMSFFE